MNTNQKHHHLPADEREKKQYGLFTAITMVVGIVIGSGIFFKSDNILIATGGNVLLGALLFCFAAISIIFGSLSFAELAARTDKPGGIMNYARSYLSPAMGSAYGWFQTFVYMPSLTIVVAWVAGVYTCQFLALPAVLEYEVLIGTFFVLFFSIMNMWSAKVGGFFQNGATVIKLIPLLVIGCLGFTSGNAVSVIRDTAIPSGSAWLFTIPAIAYSFDGWIVSTSIAHEIKDSKKNLPRALVVSPLIILAMYLIYFVGISILIGPQRVMEIGDEHVVSAANLLFGVTGEKIINFLIIISVVGTVNGLIMGMLQMPYAMGLDKSFFFSDWLAKTNKKQFPVNSAVFSIVISLLWMLAHYITQKFQILYNSDVSEISIVVSYLMYIPLYIKVIGLYRRGEIGVYRGLICPILATLGSLIIFCGGLQNQYFMIYIAIGLSISILGFLYYRMANSENELVSLEEEL